MNVDEIERKVASGELTAAQVFTQMKQHVAPSKTAKNMCNNLQNIGKSGWDKLPDPHKSFLKDRCDQMTKAEVLHYWME